jgi:hypothetical protein
MDECVFWVFLAVFPPSNETCAWRTNNLMFLLTIFNRDRTEGSYWKYLVTSRAKLIPWIGRGKIENEQVGKGHFCSQPLSLFISSVNGITCSCWYTLIVWFGEVFIYIKLVQCVSIQLHKFFHHYERYDMCTSLKYMVWILVISDQAWFLKETWSINGLLFLHFGSFICPEQWFFPAL